MTPTTMQQAINAEYGTFDEAVEAVWYNPDAADVRVLTPHSGVYSYETGGGLMFEWVLGVEEKEE